MLARAHAEIFAETRCELALVLKAAVRRNIDQRQSGPLEQVSRLLGSLPHDILVRSGAHGLPEQGGKVRAPQKMDSAPAATAEAANRRE